MGVEEGGGGGGSGGGGGEGLAGNIANMVSTGSGWR